MRVLVVADLLPVLIRPALAVSPAEWCSDPSTSMFLLISNGYEVKASYQRDYASSDSKNTAAMPNGVRAETALFLQKGASLWRCTEDIKWNYSIDATCARLVERYDADKPPICK